MTATVVIASCQHLSRTGYFLEESITLTGQLGSCLTGGNKDVSAGVSVGPPHCRENMHAGPRLHLTRWAMLFHYCRTHNVRVCLYIAYIACGSALLYIKTLYFFSVLWCSTVPTSSLLECTYGMTHMEIL